MKVMATFDTTPYAEATLPLLQRLANAPEVEFTLLAIAPEPNARVARTRRTVIAYGSSSVVTLPGEPQMAETKDQAMDRRLAELHDYLVGLAGNLSSSAKVTVEAHISDNAAKTIVQRAKEEQPDVIVMATHSRGRLSHLLFGSTTEEVVRSGIAPVLVVHPKQD